MSKLKVLDLFSGIGGFSLGLERTGGFETVAFCEIEEFPRRVLAKHWPKVPCFNDVRELKCEDVGPIDVICGGFPCQDVSIAGLGAGLDGERSGLWAEYRRLIGEFRPKYVLVENVSALLSRGMGRVLGDLAALGYDAEWHCIPSAYVGTRHIRDRVWIVAYPSGNGLEGAISIGDGLAKKLSYNWREVARASFSDHVEGWASQPTVLGKDDDVPTWMDEVECFGNAVVPKIPEMIGYAILEAAA